QLPQRHRPRHRLRLAAGVAGGLRLPLPARPPRLLLADARLAAGAAGHALGHAQAGHGPVARAGAGGFGGREGGVVAACGGWAGGVGVVGGVAVILFYVGYVSHGNYGGWTSGARWLIWLTPLWLVALVPAADWLSGRRWGRGVAYVLLALSVLSASYPAWNPW